MGTLDKLKRVFVEEKSKEYDFLQEDCGETENEESINENVEISSVNSESIIADIYQANGLDDTSQSIFKVEEIIQSLPKEMTRATKNATVIAILNSFNLTPEVVTEDGEARLQLLASALLKIKSETEEEISDKSEVIEAHKQAIEALEKDIAEREVFCKTALTAFDYENERVNELIHFIREGEK